MDRLSVIFSPSYFPLIKRAIFYIDYRLAKQQSGQAKLQTETAFADLR
jgi:hypothetical protein